MREFVVKMERHLSYEFRVKEKDVPCAEFKAKAIWQKALMEGNLREFLVDEEYWVHDIEEIEDENC